jgi:hypothetical protein
MKIRIAIFIPIILSAIFIPIAAHAVTCCVCGNNTFAHSEAQTNETCAALAVNDSSCKLRESDMCKAIAGSTAGDTCCVCNGTSFHKEARDQVSCDKVNQEWTQGSSLGSCKLMKIPQCVISNAPPVMTKLEEEFKLKDVVLGVTIPSLQFSAPPSEADAEGNIYIPWLGEYIKAIYNFSIVIISIIAVVVLIIAGAQIITSAGGPAKAAGYKRITQAVIGLFIAWGSYAVLNTINPNLTVFKPLKIAYIETIPLIDVISEPVTTQFPDAKNGNVPIIRQFDKRWGNIIYGPTAGCTTIAAAGCGPTSFAMILSSYGVSATPVDTAQFMGTNGRICNKGTAMGPALKALANSPWPTFTGKSVTKTQAIELLKQNKPIIFLCSKCTGTSSVGPKSYGGHYMVLTNMISESEVGVNDPGANDTKAIKTMTVDQLNANKGFWYVHPQ